MATIWKKSKELEKWSEDNLLPLRRYLPDQGNKESDDEIIIEYLKEKNRYLYRENYKLFEISF